LRLSHLLTQVAHGITSTVQRFAALPKFTKQPYFCDYNSRELNCV
jgi:hypothetical protein